MKLKTYDPIKIIGSWTRPLRYRFKNKKFNRIRQALINTEFIGITGSCGKSTTTLFLGKILSDHDKTIITLGKNMLSGMYLTLRKTKKHHRFAVQEIAAWEPGSLEKSVNVFQPTIGIVLNIGQDHCKAYKSIDAIAAEKSFLVKKLPHHGTAILNYEDPLVMAMTKDSMANTLTFGTNKEADVVASEISASWPNLLSLTISHKGETVRVQTGLFGEILVTSILAAVAGAIACNIPMDQIQKSLHGITTFQKRLEISQAHSGVWFVDDSYKAPLWTIDKVLSQMKEAHAPRKTIVIGNVSDITGASSPKYRTTARNCLEYADRVIFVGEWAKHVKKIITDEFKDRLFTFDTLKQAHEYLEQSTVVDEVIFLKSTNRKHLERLRYSSKSGLHCWLENCSIDDMCLNCEKSGIVSHGEQSP